MNATSVQMVRAEGGVARREVDLHRLAGWRGGGVGMAFSSESSGAQRARVRSLPQSSSAQASSVRDGDAEMAARDGHVICGYNV